MAVFKACTAVLEVCTAKTARNALFWGVLSISMGVLTMCTAVLKVCTAQTVENALFFKIIPLE